MASGYSPQAGISSGKVPTTFVNDDSSGASSDGEWEETHLWDSESVETNIVCLFCEENFKDVESALPHCANAHQFDLAKLKVKLGLDDYSYIKLINFIRKNKVDPKKTDFTDSSSWNSIDYLKMVVPNDPWACFDIEDLVIAEPDKGGDFSAASLKTTISNGKSNSEYISELEATISQLKLELQEKNSRLETATEDFKRMSKVIQSVVLDEGNEEKTLSSPCVKSIPASMDNSYFDSYADFSIHREMLLDHVRTNSYKNSIMSNADTIAGKTVLDLGCGTGILSMFAADAGAKKVIGIDQSDIIYNAMDVIRDNGFKNNEKIELVKGRIEDTELPIEKVDIIISEWMGYFLLFEAMLDSVVYARDHHLVKPGGIIMPNRLSLKLLGASDMDLHKETFGMWSNCYGYKMSCLKEEFLKHPPIRVIDSANIVTSDAVLLDLDVLTCDTNSVNFSSKFQLNVSRCCLLTCLVGYFDTFFDLPNPVSFSTGPASSPTHWKQTVFLLPEPVSVTEGQCIEGKLVCRRHPKEVRSLIVDINVFDLKLNFIIS